MQKQDIPQLEELRKEIDRIDNAWMELLSERFKVTELVGKRKALDNINPVDEGREERQFKKMETLAVDKRVDPELAKKILRLIIDRVVENHKDIASK